MKPMNPKSQRLQKWGLFVLLTGSIGFSLSMNPDHFNNIARNEGPLRMFEFAQTTTPAVNETAPGSGTSAAAPAATPAAKPSASDDAGLIKARIVRVTLGKDICRVTVMEKEGVLKGDVRKETEAQPCRWADQKELDLKTLNIKSETLIQEIYEKLAGMEVAKTDDKKSKTEVDLEEWAKPCDKHTQENAQIRCHKTRLSELSKHVSKNKITEGESLVTEYFTQHLESVIKDGLMKPTIRETSVEDCETDGGTSVYATSMFGRIGCQNDEKLNDALALSKEITRGLVSSNAKGVVDRLALLTKKSFPKQMQNSQALARSGFNEGNDRKFYLGMRGMGVDPLNPLYTHAMSEQYSVLNNVNEDFLSAIHGMPGSAASKADLIRSVDRLMYSPITNLLGTMKASLRDNTKVGREHPFFDLRFDTLAGTSWGLDNDTFTDDPFDNILARGRGLRGKSLRTLGAAIPGLDSRRNVLDTLLDNAKATSRRGLGLRRSSRGADLDL